MPTCISSSQSITTTALTDAASTGADYEVVVNASQTSLTITFTPTATINAVEVTNPPNLGDGDPPATSNTAGTITFSTGDGTPSGGVDYWIVSVDYDTSGEAAASVSPMEIPTKLPKFKPVADCSS